jgi:hypothetical protein
MESLEQADDNVSEISDSDHDNSDSGSDIDLGSSSKSESEHDYDGNASNDEFENCEEEFELHFPKRLSCIDHGIELTTSKVIDNSEPIKRALKTVRKQIRKVRKSPKLKADIKKKIGRIPLLPCVTRWSGNFLMLDVYIPMAHEINRVNFAL